MDVNVLFEVSFGAHRLIKKGFTPPMNCPHCGTPRFADSRIRLRDIPRLFLLQVPVRCLLCRERFSISMSMASRMRQNMNVAGEKHLQNSR
jgi:hypothetical protein